MANWKENGLLVVAVLYALISIAYSGYFVIGKASADCDCCPSVYMKLFAFFCVLMAMLGLYMLSKEDTEWYDGPLLILPISMLVITVASVLRRGGYGTKKCEFTGCCETKTERKFTDSVLAASAGACLLFYLTYFFAYIHRG